MSNFDLAVFDLAGTTVKDDQAVATCFHAALAAFNRSASQEDVNARMGIPKPQAIAELAPDADAEEAAAIHRDFRRRMVEFYATSDAVGEVPGAGEVFRKLKAAGIKIAVDTGFDREIVNVLLPRMGWGDLVDDSITSDEVENGRPAPDMIFALMARLGVTDPQRVAKIGDTPSDLGQGTSAGCRFVIGVTNGTHSAEQLRPYPHTHLVGSVIEVPDLLLADA